MARISFSTARTCRRKEPSIMEDNDPIVIASAARTPMGAFQGELASLSAPALGATALRAVIARAGIHGHTVDEAFIGNVLPAGLGQAPARQAVRLADLPDSVACTTVSKVCGSGMQAVMLAHDAIAAGSSEVVLAGGMESMSNAPYLLPKARGGYRVGHGRVLDHLMMDGLEDAYDIAPDGTRRSMGTFGEDCAAKYRFSRERQDAYALETVRRARQATEEGAFAWEIAPVSVNGKAGAVEVASDESPRRIKAERMASLQPAFRSDGTITAASSSSLSDGAAALLLMRASKARALNVRPLALVVGHSVHAQAPDWFTTAPVGAVVKLCRKVGWSTAQVDLFEINEAFAVVPMAAMAELGIERHRVNVHGGACALGHPIGASGARIVVTLLGALRHRRLKRGIATLCIGGGEATAIAIEVL
jgi:acetyl-CoA C-acetyltransferase